MKEKISGRWSPNNQIEFWLEKNIKREKKKVNMKAVEK